MPRPRIRGKLGVVHSDQIAMESHTARPDSLKEHVSNYAAAVLTRVPVDIVTPPVSGPTAACAGFWSPEGEVLRRTASRSANAGALSSIWGIPAKTERPKKACFGGI